MHYVKGGEVSLVHWLMIKNVKPANNPEQHDNAPKDLNHKITQSTVKNPQTMSRIWAGLVNIVTISPKTSHPRRRQCAWIETKYCLTSVFTLK